MAAKEKWRVLSNPPESGKEMSDIHIRCLDAPGSEDEYVVCATPRSKKSKPGKENKGFSYVNPIERAFSSKEQVIKYLEEIL